MTKKPALNKSLVKGLSILRSFKDREHQLSFSEIVSLTDMEKSSVQRMLQTLKFEGYLDQEGEGQKYSLGVRVIDLAYAFLQSHPLIDRVGPYLVDLRQASGERVDLSIRHGLDLVYILRMQSKRDLYAPALFGRRLPLYCTAGGKAIMSYLPPSEAAAILKESNVEAKTRSTVVEKSKLQAQLKKAREDGYAYQREEVRRGAVAVGAAVLDRSGYPIGAIHIAGSTSNWDGDKFREKMGPLIASVASEINSP